MIKPGDIYEIIEREAAAHGLEASTIVGRSRKANVVFARRCAIARVRAAHPGLSWTYLGAIFNRDHTSVMYLAGALPNHCNGKGARRRDQAR